MKLVIVESPTKAKTIRKYLGSDYHVLASMGHVRDLPGSADEIPDEYKKTPWGQYGVNIEKDFEPLYIVPSKKAATIRDLKKALKEADELYLATDEDREGESISWHLMDLLKPKVPVHRMVFHEITKTAIQNALAKPRAIDESLVRAQETRRILDRLVGYTLSPVLWKKIAFGLSAGRVQSAALEAIVQRERARLAFKKASYWDVIASLEQGKTFDAKLVKVQDQAIAQGKDFDEQTGALNKDSRVLLVDEQRARAIAEQVKSALWTITDIQEKPMSRRPPAPFITSTLQQEANRKLGLSSKEAMRAAQALYENGHITYMRTDSTNLSEDAISAARSAISVRFGADFLPPSARRYEAKAKGAQEAHEAIRPSLTFASPDEIGLTGVERDLYELIWMRTLASQMTDSSQLQTTVVLSVSDYTFQTSGMRILNPGFLRAYAEGADDAEQALSDQERPLPALSIGDQPTCLSTESQAHETKPPARFTEAGLIQWMEKEGIGRPSTYASIISTLVDRQYVRKDRNALIPTFTAFAVTLLLEKHFADLVDAKFTSRMEESLDEIAAGQKAWLPYLQEFFLGEPGLLKRIEREVQQIQPDEAKTVRMPHMPEVEVKIGRFGAYFEAVDPRNQLKAKANVPEGMSPADFTQEVVDELIKKSVQGPASLGVDPVSGKIIYLKSGSYGPYLELGEAETTDAKPKRVSVPKDVPLETLDIQKAQFLVSLPRTLGTDPETGKDVKVGLGRFGPYVVRDGEFRSLKKEDTIFSMTIERALELLREPKGTRRRSSATPHKVLGEHPKDKQPVTLHNGKFGWYVKYKTKNATIPKDRDPETLTLAEALELIGAKKTTRKRKASAA